MFISGVELLFFRFNWLEIEIALYLFVFLERVAFDCFDSFKRREILWFVSIQESVIFPVLSFDRSLFWVCLSDFIIGEVGIFASMTYITRLVGSEVRQYCFLDCFSCCSFMLGR